VSVAWATADGTATAGADYVAASGTVTFAAGTTSATIAITTLGDTTYESDETFTVTLSNPQGATIGTGSATVTITNDDAAPVLTAVSLTVSDPSAGETGPNTGSFTITRATNPTGTIVINLTWGGTATHGSDYTVSATGGTLSADRTTLIMADGVGSALITITPLDDTATESTETVTLTLAAGSGYTLGSPTSGSVSIADNDGATAPTISIGSVTVTEGDNGNFKISIPITLSAPWTSSISVSWATGGGTTTAGKDYRAASGTVTFSAGQTSATISITIINDKTAEPTETFNVTLSNPTGGATIGVGTGTVTILDNDGGGGAGLLASRSGGDEQAATPLAPAVQATHTPAVTTFGSVAIAPAEFADVPSGAAQKPSAGPPPVALLVGPATAPVTSEPGQAAVSPALSALAALPAVLAVLALLAFVAGRSAPFRTGRYPWPAWRLAPV
jgi:chitinase